MALIYKNKNKIFKIRRKNLNWFKNKVDFKNIKNLTTKLYIWTMVSSDVKKFFFLKPYVYVSTNSIYEMGLWKNNFNFDKKHITLYHYTKYCNKFISLNFNDKQEIINQETNLVVISTPKTQLFFTITKHKVFLVFTCGVIRLVMQLVDKCSKKKKIVILNGVKFMWNSCNALFKKNLKIKFKKNFTHIRSIFNKNYEEAKIVDTIFYEPKINFGYNDFKKRTFIKKKLRKKKKYKSE